MPKQSMTDTVEQLKQVNKAYTLSLEDKIALLKEQKQNLEAKVNTIATAAKIELLHSFISEFGVDANQSICLDDIRAKIDTTVAESDGSDFIASVYEIAFGKGAIERPYPPAQVIKELKKLQATTLEKYSAFIEDLGAMTELDDSYALTAITTNPYTTDLILEHDADSDFTDIELFEYTTEKFNLSPEHISQALMADLLAYFNQLTNYEVIFYNTEDDFKNRKAVDMAEGFLFKSDAVKFVNYITSSNAIDFYCAKVQDQTREDVCVFTPSELNGDIEHEQVANYTLDELERIQAAIRKAFEGTTHFTAELTPVFGTDTLVINQFLETQEYRLENVTFDLHVKVKLSTKLSTPVLSIIRIYKEIKGDKHNPVLLYTASLDQPDILTRALESIDRISNAFESQYSRDGLSNFLNKLFESDSELGKYNIPQR
jgi:hypothetical protein